MAGVLDHEEVQVQSVMPCDTCDNAAEHLCKTCHDKLCSRCKGIHTKCKSSFDHEITLLTFESLSLINEVPSVQVCRSHPGFRTNVCCKECEIPICEKCLVFEHNGHKVILTEELYIQKKKNLDQKFKFLQSELPKYQSYLDGLIKDEKINEKQCETLETEIVAHFKETRLKLELEEKHLLQTAKSKQKQEHCRIQIQKKHVSEYMTKMQSFISKYQNEIASERHAFILYADVPEESQDSEAFQRSPFPHALQFMKEKLDDELFIHLSGKIAFNTADTHLIHSMIEVDAFRVEQGSVQSLTYHINDDAFWVFSEGETSFKKYNRSGIVIFEVTTEVAHLRNQPICLADGSVLFRKKRCLLTQLNKNGEETVFLDFDAAYPICMYCPEENTGVVIGIINSELTEGKLSKYDKHGHCTNEIKNSLLFKNLVSSKTKCRGLSAYIAENINGDICISHKDVDVFDKKGNFRFSYYGHRNTNLEFQPRGICTDTLGHIVVADAGNHSVHVLDGNGNLQKLYDVSSKENDFKPITLTVDANYSLCIGCSDGKIRIFKYIE
nr:uncharacterized protein LOC117691011 isoform X1 [Crassostrea gigas]